MPIKGFLRRAQALGMTVDAYLNEFGTAPMASDGFQLTPEVRKAIEEGIEDVENGRTFTTEEVRQKVEDRLRSRGYA